MGSEGGDGGGGRGSAGGRALTGLPVQVVIKYVPYVGDSKRALDEYTSEIMMGGTNTIVIHNTCEVRGCGAGGGCTPLLGSP